MWVTNERTNFEEVKKLVQDDLLIVAILDLDFE